MFKRELTKCQIPSRLEPLGLSNSSSLRPDGVTQVPWSRGRVLAWDFTCAHTLCASYMRTTGGQVGEAARLAETKKLLKYSDLSNVLFTPIAMETLGVPGPAARDFIKELGRRQCDALGDPRATSQLWQRISLQLQRGNARCVFETFSD